MSKTAEDKDIDALLAALDWGSGALTNEEMLDRSHAALTALVAERDALREQLAAMQKQRDEARRALKEIAYQDYRGHPSTESQIAMNALAAMRKGEQL